MTEHVNLGLVPIDKLSIHPNFLCGLHGAILSPRTQVPLPTWRARLCVIHHSNRASCWAQEFFLSPLALLPCIDKRCMTQYALRNPCRWESPAPSSGR